MAKKSSEQAKEVFITKARYWWAVLYPENMRDGWEAEISDILQVPFAYCLHDQSKDSKSEHRKDHIHLIVVFANTTTYKHAMSVFSLLNAPGKNAVNTCQAIINIRHAYDYLIHDTKSCEKAGKEKYDPDQRITGNNFDIGMYEQISETEKTKMLEELADFIVDNNFCDFTSFYIAAGSHFDATYFQIISGRSSFLEKLTKGNYQRTAVELNAREAAVKELEKNLEDRVETLVTAFLGSTTKKAVTEDGR